LATFATKYQGAAESLGDFRYACTCGRRGKSSRVICYASTFASTTGWTSMNLYRIKYNKIGDATKIEL